MNVHSELVEPATPVLSYDSMRFWRAEDSGYHTFTPSSIDCSELSTENIDPSGSQGPICINRGTFPTSFKNTPESNPRVGYHYSYTTNTLNESFPDRPSKRRGVKRPYQDETDTNDVSYGSIPTPTSVIAGQIQKLKVNDSANISGRYSLTSFNSDYADTSSFCNFNSLSFPSTPVKKICKSSCKLNKLKSNHKSSPLRPINNLNCPPRKFARQLDFEIHSLACEPQSLQVIKPPPCSNKPLLQFKPNQKIDIIKMLHEKVLCVPAISKIISYLSPADIFNFTLVSPIWLQVCEDVIEGREKLKQYLKLSKENQENKRHNSTPKNTSDVIRRKLKEIHNIENVEDASNSSSSPPVSPRTRRFKTFSRVSLIFYSL